MHGLFPEPVLRRQLLKSVGAAALLGALGGLLPIDTLKAIAQEKKPLEKTELVGFLAITCAAPLIYGEQIGAYAKEGLEVSLQKVPGIALIRDKMVSGELDVSQQVMPVALTMSAGLGGNQQSIKVLTFSTRMATRWFWPTSTGITAIQELEGFYFAVPFDQSHQALQLRNYLAAHGLDPDKDVTYRVVPPTEYVSNLRVGSMDGFFGGEPGGQRAVYEGAGFIHRISRENGTAIPAVRSPRRKAGSPRTRTPSWRSTARSGREPVRLGQEQSRRYGEGAGAAAISQCARGRTGAGHHRPLRRWPRQHQGRSAPCRLSAVSALRGGGVADDATAALEHAQGRHRLQEARRAGDGRDRRIQNHARERRFAAGGQIWQGNHPRQRVRFQQAGRISQVVRKG